jgi:purine-binding chemotaxis protein CheW
MTDRGADRSPATGGAARQLIGFRLGPERFGIDISRIHEIIKPLPLTVVPDMPPGYSGLIRLRDQVVVIADLHGRFAFPRPQVGKETRIIVLAGINHKIGVMVDAVSEVVRLTPAMIDPSPAFSGGVSVEFIEGIGKLGDDLITVLDVGALFPDPASPQLDQLVEAHLAAEVEASAPAPEAGMAVVEEAMMQELGRKAETGDKLYHDIGELARYINLAHRTFAESIPESQNINIKAPDLPTANDLLKKVTQDTETATMKVMANTEETVSAVTELRAMLEQVEEAVPAADQGRAAISDLAERMRGELANIQNVQDDTVVALSFQDLTGQKIKQVINLMGDVEERILALVVQYGVTSADQATDVAGRLQDLKEPDVAAMRQDKVDDLLADFGF